MSCEICGEDNCYVDEHCEECLELLYDCTCEDDE